MSEITSFNFNEQGFESLRDGNYRYGEDWPVVYIIEDGTEAYIGKTTRILGRSKEHYKLEERKKLTHLHIITDSTYNMSAITDIESSLIQYMSADGSRILQNANGGTQDHSYYDREMYQAKFTDIWSKLLEGPGKLAKKTLIDIANSDLFKYSPYKVLTEDQDEFVKKIVADIKDDKTETYIVNGQPGTGKTVLATYLMKYLKENESTKDLKIALVIPMGALRKTIQSVFKNIKGLKANMVVTASDVAKGDYDLVIVDESHRLKRRKNLGAAFGAFDNTNKALGLDKESTHVDWIMKKSKRQIFFYDQDQSVMPADVGHIQFDKLKAKKYNLTTQLRVQAGTKYINFVRDMLYVRDVGDYGTHDIKLYDDPSKMVADIKEKDSELGLCRVVAGYAWPWLSNPNRNERPAEYDIDLGDCKLKWNSTAVDWVNSPNSINEVGCIHTTQGYDLNYVGVIIGPELKYDPIAKEMVIDRAEYYDKNGRMGVVDDGELKQYIINIYKTLLVRGIKGTYIYAVDENLREYLRDLMPTDEQRTSGRQKMFEIASPEDIVMIPLLGYASCGDPIEAINNPEDEIGVDKNKIRPGHQYFIIIADGDSMNLAGIQDGDLVLCKFGEKGETGDRVVALLNGGDVTIKMYDKKGGRRILLPKSDNKEHQPIVPCEGDSVIGIVQEVLEDKDV
jgi:DUF2075 family protein/DNA replication protein DnaC